MMNLEEECVKYVENILKTKEIPTMKQKKSINQQVRELASDAMFKMSFSLNIPVGTLLNALEKVIGKDTLEEEQAKAKLMDDASDKAFEIVMNAIVETEKVMEKKYAGQDGVEEFFDECGDTLWYDEYRDDWVLETVTRLIGDYENRVYIIPADETNGNPDDIEDSEFMNMAEELGDVMTLDKFVDDWNYNEYRMPAPEQSYIRIIKISKVD